MFSSRTPLDLTPNRLTTLRARLQHEGRSIVDLTESNPTRAGLLAPADLLALLGEAESRRYAPEPRGLHRARAAVAADYQRRHVDMDPARIVLTASTSEAYGFLFKLLCDPGDEVLIPHPSYPLFEHLTRLEAVRAISYPMYYDGLWHVEMAQLVERMSPRTRAVLVVSPNNPTGSLLGRSDQSALVGLCAGRGVALICDEVFADYGIEPRADASPSAVVDRVCLSFALGGLSKSVALPQLKLAWIAVGGPDALVQPALDRLELVADTYLSVSTPVQVAAAELLRRGTALRERVAERVLRNYRVLGEALGADAETPCTRLRAEGGWTAVLQVPAVQSDEELSLGLLDNEGVLVHPGYFYDFPRDGFLAVSLLAEPAVFDDGIARLLRYQRRVLHDPGGLARGKGAL